MIRVAKCAHGDIVTIERHGELQLRLMIKFPDGWLCRALIDGKWSEPDEFVSNYEKVELVEEQRSKGTNERGKGADPLMGMRGEFKLVGE